MTPQELPNPKQTNSPQENPPPTAKLPVVLAGAFTVCLLTAVFLSHLSVDSLPKPPNLTEAVQESQPDSGEKQDIFALPPQDLDIQEEPSNEVQPVYIDHMEEGGLFQLPLYGSSGIIGVKSSLFDEMDGTPVTHLSAGEGFYVLEEEGQWWQIMLEDGTSGWVSQKDCLINLPDLVPSIIYDNPYASLCTSCSLGKDIPNVTGHKLYHCSFFNKRLDKEEYLTPVLYETAKKIQKLQQNALSDGYSLYIYEGFRPATVQAQLVEGLSTLMSQDEEVYQALTSSPWNANWFVSTGISSHQKGQAVDMSLVKVEETEIFYSGDYQYEAVTAYSTLEMPTPFDELSPLSAVYTAPVSTTGDAWKTATFSDSMTESAILLHNYATEAGFLPLASEWWHFSDPDGQESNIVGNFLPDDCYSVPPYKTNRDPQE